MTDIAVSQSASAFVKDSAEPSCKTPGIFAGVFVMSLSSLLLELALTRLFSVVLFYHFAFLAISIALLGLGTGGVFAHLARTHLARWQTRRLGVAASAINAVAILVALEVVLHTSVTLRLSIPAFLRVSLIYLVSAVPFFFTGLMFSVVFAREKSRVAALYGADLLGGACACLALVPLLNIIGGPNTVIFAGLGMALAAVFWADTQNRRRSAVIGVALLAMLIAANYSGRLVDIVYTKGFYRQSEFARWNAISRTDVYRTWDGARWASIDADASTAIMNLDPDDREGSGTQRLMSEVPSVANALWPRGSYAIIGPGGGVDVLRAVIAGSPSITGIEINPLIADTIMRDKYAEYSHHLYQLPQVHIEVSDGRSWIRSSRQQFDVVQMTLVDTWASTAAGAFALSENNLYTVEAFKEYFEHLKPDGLVAITRWEFRRPREALRVVSVAMEALRQLGVSDPAKHFIIVSDGPLLEDGIPVLVLAKKAAFTAHEEAVVSAHLKKSSRLNALYMPSEPGHSPFSALIASRDPYGFSRTYDFNVSPVRDNKPFFFFTMKLDQIRNAGLKKGIDWKINVGVAVLGMVLIISLLAVAAFLVLPLWLRVSRGRGGHSIYYFIAVGLGYILVEIAFIQRFVLFLGHPTYAITVVVFLMLLASGLGSAASRRLLPNPQQVRFALVVIITAILICLFVLPHILTTLVGLAFPIRLLISAALLAPIAFAMGMPFPSGLRALHGAGEDTIEWAWAMNAAASVLGSVLAMVIAIRFGLQATLACGAVAYLAATALTTFSSKKA